MMTSIRHSIFVLVSLLFGMQSLAIGQNQFNPVDPTGLPYHIIINSNSITGVYNASQVEIGIFDGALCVGSGTVTINSSQTLDIVVWEGDPTYSLEGFTSGNPISIQLAIDEYGTNNIISAAVSYSIGDGSFGYGSYSVASVTGSIEAVPNIEVNPTRLAFGSLDLGETDVRSFMVKNLGSVTLSVNSISVPNGFSISTGTFNVAPDDSQQVWVTFSPSSPTDYSGNIRINCNDPYETQANVELTGQGLADLVPEMIVNPTSLAFGAMPVGNSEMRNFTIRNQGSAVLNIYSVSTNHTDISAQYSSFALQPGEEQLIEVEFSPGVGSISGSVLILHNDSSTPSPYTVSVTGYGYDDYFSPVPETGLPYVTLINHVVLDDHSLPYGSQVGIFDGNLCVGSAVYLGAYPLQVTAWEADPGNDLAGFTQGDSITIKVRTTAYDSVTVINGDIDFSVGDGLFGTGSYSVISLNLESNLAPHLYALPSSLEFPLTTTGEISAKTFIIYNTGATDLIVSGWNMDNNAFYTSTDVGRVNSGDSVEVEIFFSPPSGAWHQGNFYIYSNDPDNLTQVVQLSGAGVLSGQPVIHVPITNFNLGDVVIGETGTLAIQIFNTGNDTLTINGISSTNGAFQVPATPIQIPENSSMALDVSSLANAIGWFTTEIIINSNAANTPSLQVAIQAYGYDAYFDPVAPTGEQYQIVVTDITDASGYGLDEGDEIGVFDGLQCVGVGVYHGSDSLSISTWEAIPDQSLPGYTDGNLIQFKYHLIDDDSNEHVFDIIPEFISGDGAFGTGIFSLVNLEIIDRVTPFEPYAGPVFYVSADSGLDYINNGSFEQPFRTIQHSINVVENADTILVRPGAYVENINFNGKNIVLSSLFLITGDTSYISQTVINGGQNGSVVTFKNGETNLSSLSGVTITNGQSNEGGGVYCSLGSSPVIKNTRIIGNFANSGAGIRIDYSSEPLLQDIEVTWNTAQNNGGGIFISRSAQPTIENSLIQHNRVEIYHGGGIWVDSGASLSLTNSIVSNNYAERDGGGIGVQSAQLLIKNVTLAGNVSSFGGGLQIDHIADVAILNSIIWNNSPQQVYIPGYADACTLSVDYSSVENGQGGIVDEASIIIDWSVNNLESYPEFIDETAENYHLNSTSTCIDAGDPITNYSKEPEPNGDRINMGAYGNTSEAAIATLSLIRPDTAATEDSLYSVNLSVSPDSQVVFSYELLASPAWVNFDDSLALISGTPDNSYVGAHEVIISVSDNYSRLDTLVYDVIVSNSQPFITSVADTIATEDQLYYYDLNANDEGFGPTAYRALILPVWLSLDSLSGELTGVPGDSAVGDTVVSIQFVDGFGGSDTQNFSVHVVNMNDAIAIVSNPDTTAIEDLHYVYEVQTLDDDLNDATRFSLNIAPYGMVIDSLTGRISWLPDNSSVGDTLVSFSVVDDSGSTDIQTYNLHVLNTNDAPLISSVPDTIATEDAPYTYQVVGEDVDLGDNIHYSLLTAPSGMQIDDSNGLITWTPTNDAVGDTLVMVVVADDTAATDTQSFFIHVENVNDAPVVNNPMADFSVDEDSPAASYALYDIFHDDDISSVNDSLSFQVVNNDQDLISAHISNDSLHLSFLPDQNGIVTLEITAVDLDSASVSESVTVTINPVNDAPVIVSTDSTAATEDIIFVYHAQAGDVDNGSLNFSFEDIPSWLTADSDSIYGTPTEGIGDFAFQLIVNDSELYDTLSVFVKVIPQNDPPLFSSIAAITFEEDIPYYMNLNSLFSRVHDPDDHDSTLNWSFINTANIQVSLSSDSIMVKNTSDWFGVENISVVVSDTALSDTTNWLITVLSIEDFPRITSTPDTIGTEDRLYRYDIEAYDPDPGDSIIFVLDTAPWDMLIDEHTGVIEWSPSNDDVGDTLVTFTVTDATNRSTSMSFPLHVINANDAIQIVSVADTIALEDEEYIYAVETLDDDLNDQARFSLNIAPFGMSIDSLNGHIRWFPNNENVGDTVVSFSVIDDSGATDSQSYILHVLNINDSPVISSIADTVAIEDQPYSYSVVASDDDLGDKLNFSLLSAPQGMTIDDSTGVITWLPDNGDVGDTLVTIIARDDSSAIDTQSFVLHIENVNDPPVIIFNITDFIVAEDAPDTSFALQDIFHDDDLYSVDDSLIFTLTNSPPGIVNASIARDTLYLDYLENQNGTVNLSITATDIPQASATASFLNTITAVNDIPSSFNLITEDGIVFYDSVITFSWEASLDPDVLTNGDQLFYTFRYSSVEDFSTYSDIEDISDTSLTLDLAFIQDQPYYWKVRVEDFYRAKIWSDEVRTFSLNYEDNPPETPHILAPIAAAVLDTNSLIVWSQSQDEDLGDTVSYILEIATDYEFGDILATYTGRDTIVSLTDLNHSALNENAKHYIRMRAFDNDTLFSSWTELLGVYWDNVNEKPDQVVSLLTPVHEIVTTLTPSLIWRMSSDIDPGDANFSLNYSGEVWNSVDTLIFTTEPGDTNYITTIGLTENEIYEWAVQAVDDGGLSSVMSDTAIFWVNTQNEAPGPFSLLAPSNDTLDTSRPTFTWTLPIDPDVGTVLSYNLRYSLSATFDSYSEVEGISDTSYTLLDSLDDDLQYFWKIEAQDEFGATVWSQNINSFVVNAVNSVPTTPSALDIEPYSILNLGDSFSWTPSFDGDPGDVVIYQVVIMSDTTFSDTMECGHESTEGLVLYCYWVTGSYITVTTEIINAITQSENGVCYGTIRGFDLGGLPSDWSPLVPFYVDNYNEAPSAPIPFGITSGEILNTQTPLFTFEAGWDPDPRDPVGSLVYGGTCWNENDVREFIIGYDTTYVIDTLWENSGYWVCFWARDTSGLYSANSDTVFFWVNSVNESPLAFNLIEPLSDTLDTSYPTFSWHTSSDPDINAVLSYTLRYSQSASFSTYSEVEGLSDTTHTLADSLADDLAYYWKVRVSDEFGLSRWSDDTFSFYVNAVNSAPSVPMLGDIASVLDTSGTIDWSTSIDTDLGGSVSYVLQVSSNASFTDTLASYNTTLTSVGINELDYTDFIENAQHGLRVKAVDNSGLPSTWSSVVSYYWDNVNEAPEQVSALIMPLDEVVTTLTPVFEWALSTDIDPGDTDISLSYLGTVWSAVDTLNFNTDPGDTSHTMLTDLSENEVYEWSVRTLDDGGLSSIASDTGSFWVNSVNESPEAFTLIEPLLDTLDTSYPSFSWYASTDPDINAVLSYTLRYSQSENFSTYSEVEGLSDTTHTLSDSLADDLAYYWRVKVSDEFGLSRWSDDTFSFYVNAVNSAPSVPELSDIASILDTNATVTWTTSTDEDLGDEVTYQLQLAPNPDFVEDIILDYTIYSGSDTSFALSQLAPQFVNENDMHYLRVRSLDHIGANAGWSEIVSFWWDNVNENPDQVSSLYAPLDEVVTTLMPDFEWSQSSDIDPGDTDGSLSYLGTVWSAVDTFSFNTDPGDTTQILLSELTENEVYQWTVRSLDDGGLLSNWSDTASFWVNSVNESPLAFNLIEPLSDTLDTSYPTFSWHTSSDPDINAVLSYTLRYSQSASFSTYSEVEGLSDTTHTLADSLADDLAYYWKVRVSDEFGLSRWSEDTFSFYVNAIPNIPPTANWMYTDSIMTGVTQVPYFFEDLDQEEVFIEFEYSTNAGSTWQIPTQEGLFREESLFSWNTQADLPDWYGSVWLRITPYDDEATGTGDILITAVDNIVPEVSISNIPVDQSSEVNITYLANNDYYSPTNIYVSYRTSTTANWIMILPDHFISEPLFENGVAQNLTWNSEEDLSGYVGDAVQVRVMVSDYSSSSDDVSNPFSLNNNHDPTLAITPLVGWQSDIIDIHVEYDDTENDALTFNLYFSLDGSHFIAATTEGAALASKGQIGTESLSSDKINKFVPQATVGQGSHAESVSIKASNIQADRSSANRIHVLLSSDTTLNWYSQSDLPVDYAGEVWLRATVYDAYSAVVGDTITCLVDNNLPELSIEAITGEVSGIVPITIHLDNDSENDVTITGEYKIFGSSTWNDMVFNGHVSSGTETVEIAWNSIEDLGVGSNVIIDIRMQAGDGQGIGSYAYLNLVQVDNNAVPVISSLEVVPTEPRGDILIQIYITDAEHDILTYQCQYSLNNGADFYSTTSFSVSGDYVTSGYQTITWHSFEDVVNTVNSQMRYRVTPSDNDAGVSATTSTFTIFNSGGPQFEMVMNADYPNLLWQDAIEIKFNHAMDGSTAPDGIELSSDAQVMGFDYLMTGNDSVINIIPQDAYRPGAPVQIKLTTALLDHDGYAFDGNRNSVPDGSLDDRIISLQTPELADFDFNGVLNEFDLLEFVLNWNLPNPDLSMEIGPSSGPLPYTTFYPDGLFDYEDLMVFIATWKWNKNQGGLARGIKWNPGQLTPIVKEELGVVVNRDRELELNIDLKIPEDLDITLLRYNIEGLDSNTIVSSGNLSSRFAETIRIEGDGAEFIAGLTPKSSIDQQDRILSINSCISEWTEIDIQITAWDSDGQEVFSGSRLVEVDPVDYIPREFSLDQNFPNPFNGSTTISYAIPDEAMVSLILYDIRGRQVRTLLDKNQTPGFYQIKWNGLNDDQLGLGAGIYLCRIQAGSQSQIIKMVYLK